METDCTRQQRYILGIEEMPEVTLASLAIAMERLGGYGPDSTKKVGYRVYLPEDINADTLASFRVAVREIHGSLRRDGSFKDSRGSEAQEQQDDIQEDKAEAYSDVTASFSPLQSSFFKAARTLKRFTADQIFDSLTDVKLADPNTKSFVAETLLSQITEDLVASGYNANWTYSRKTEDQMIFKVSRSAATRQEEKVAGFRMEDAMQMRMRLTAKIVRANPGIGRVDLARTLVEKLNLIGGNGHYRMSDGYEFISYGVSEGHIHYAVSPDGKKFINDGSEPDPSHPHTEAIPEPVIREGEARKEKKEWEDKDTTVLELLFRDLIDPSVHIERGVNLNKFWRANKQLQAIGSSYDHVKKMARRAERGATLSIRDAGTSHKGRRQHSPNMFARVNMEQKAAIIANPAKVLAQVRWEYELEE